MAIKKKIRKTVIIHPDTAKAIQKRAKELDRSELYIMSKALDDAFRTLIAIR